MPRTLALSVILCGKLIAAAHVRTNAGLVEGVPGSDPSVTVYRGIPFAAPPTGDLRWRAPKPAAPWKGALKADRFSPACIQTLTHSAGPWTQEFMHQGDISEDCLYLNVWTAAGGGKHPVMLWIYGGGFTSGSSAVALYDGEELARKGIVVVTINYRVGVLGFLAHPELTKESEGRASGNYGLLDQIAALEWVQANIAEFGGDPARVTIAGQSAGGVSVLALVASPLAKGLFHQAIVQSAQFEGSSPLAEAEVEGAKFMAAKGAHTPEEMRAMPIARLTAPVEGMGMQWGPVMDRWLVPDRMSTIFAQGKQNDVATLTGWTADEGSAGLSYARRTPAQKAKAREELLFSTFAWARQRALTSKTPVYTYYWDHPAPGPNKNFYGAFHSSELAYVFNSLGRANRPWEPADRAIAEKMSSYWATFVRTGDPNGPGLPPWPVFDPKSPVTMELGERYVPRPIAGK
jgi:para-nitrobenzyl esterase